MATNQKTIIVQAGNSTATTTTKLNDQLPGVPCPDPAGYKYVGARYVPLFADPIQWDETKQTTYEPLTIVLYQGNSYTSKQYVPVGIDITNEEFWANTGNYNAQVEQYRQEVQQFDARITKNANEINVINSKVSDYVTPYTFGAKGDGITDDTQAVKDALTSGKAVIIPEGTFKVSSVINPTSTIMIGRGGTIYATSIDAETPAAIIGFNQTPNADIYIEGVKIVSDLNSTRNGNPCSNRNGIAATNVKSLTVLNCYFENLFCATFSANVCNTMNTKVDNCVVMNCWAGFYCNYSNIAVTNTRMSFSIYATPTEHFVYPSLGNLDYVTIDNCYMEQDDNEIFQKPLIIAFNYAGTDQETIKLVKLSNVTSRNLNIVNNFNTNLSIENALFSNCIFRNETMFTGGAALFTLRIATNFKNMVFENCNFYSTTTYMRLFDSQYDSYVIFKNCEFTNYRISANVANTSAGNANCKQDFYNCVFNSAALGTIASACRFFSCTFLANNTTLFSTTADMIATLVVALYNCTVLGIGDATNQLAAPTMNANNMKVVNSICNNLSTSSQTRAKFVQSIFNDELLNN